MRILLSCGALLALIACGGDDRRPRTDGGDVDAASDASDGAVDMSTDMAVDMADMAIDTEDPCALVDCMEGLICNPADGACVQCLTADDCGGAECVDNACPADECETNSDCSDASASRCGESMSCEACMEDADCAHLPGGLVCGDSGCEAPPEDRTCQPCTTDTECGDGSCIPMRFDGALLEGGRCALRAPEGVGECPSRPYTSRLRGRANLAGTVIADFCSVDESLTTCQAVLDAIAITTCEGDEDCGEEGVSDSLCVETACTYACEDSDDCQPGDTCESRPLLPPDFLFCQ